MITKEELLQKGIDPVVADEILASIGTDEDSSPLEALNKALNENSEMDDLFKAQKGEGKEEEDDDEEYDEKFMKKMKKYMKGKGKGEGGDDENLFGGMKKAIENFETDADGAVIEMADLAPILDSMVETVQNMTKAISGLEKRIEIISGQNSDSYSLLSKAAAVTAETAEIVSGIGNTSVGRKGVLVSDMKKAKEVEGVDPKTVYSVLSKAVANGDLKAGAIGSKFESSGKRFNFLNDNEQSYVKELITKEAN